MRVAPRLTLGPAPRPGPAPAAMRAANRPFPGRFIADPSPRVRRPISAVRHWYSEGSSQGKRLFPATCRSVVGCNTRLRRIVASIRTHGSNWTWTPHATCNMVTQMDVLAPYREIGTRNGWGTGFPMEGTGGGKDGPGLLCRNVKVSGRRTSLRMEPYIWDSLKEICEREQMTLNEICTQIDERRGEANLTASIRVFIVSYYRTAIGQRGFSEDGQSPLLRRAMDDAVPLE
ncbi:ribbon-helix-helix domain-containing protein [Azospirillum sp. TSA6c]|uniref:ribbon-helix-helix domain-containing protein n=2 Tax=Azospirillum TaxID=191 RepID=UPI0032B85296